VELEGNDADMIEKVRMVVCDIDGTLVNDKNELTQRTKKAIDSLHANGIYFGIASGRSIDNQLGAFAKERGFDFEFEIIIGQNGSELWDGVNMQRHDYYKLKREWIKEILELMEPFDLNPFIYYNKRMLCKRIDEAMLKSSAKNSTALVVPDDPAEFYAHENAKVMFRTTEEEMPIIDAYVKSHPSPYYKGFKTQTTMLEFSDIRVSKDVPLKKFCEINNIPLEHVMSFGDLSNDNDLLACSGWGVCLKNGTDDTKAIADDITEKTNNEDGFAHYIEKHVLSKQRW